MGKGKRERFCILLSKISTTFFTLSCPFSSNGCHSSAGVVGGRYELYNRHRGHLSSHVVLCNSISHLAWAQGNTQGVNSNGGYPKAYVQLRTPRFNLNGLHQSRTWSESIPNWPPSQCSLRWHRGVHTCRMSAKWIWLNGHHSGAFQLLEPFLPQISRLQDIKTEVLSVNLHTSPEISSHSSVVRTHNPASVCRPANSGRSKSILITKWRYKPKSPRLNLEKMKEKEVSSHIFVIFIVSTVPFTLPKHPLHIPPY